MTPVALISTSALLGLFVLAGGGYGCLFSAWKLTERRGFLIGGYACYVMQALVLVAILLITPLAPIWKIFIVMSGAIYAVIPPITWRYLEQLHKSEEAC